MNAVFSPAAKRATAFRSTTAQISASENPMRADLFTRIRASVAATLKAAGLRDPCEVTFDFAGHGVTRCTLAIANKVIASKDWNAELNPVNSLEQASQRAGWIAQALVARALVRCLDDGARPTGPLSPPEGEIALSEGAPGARGNPPPVEARIELAQNAPPVTVNGALKRRRRGADRSPLRRAIEALVPDGAHVEVQIGATGHPPSLNALRQLVSVCGGRAAGLRCREMRPNLHYVMRGEPRP